MPNTATWTDEWMELQQKYWQSWADASQRLFGQETAPVAAWGSAMDNWWKSLAPRADSDLGRDFMNKMIEQGKALFAMADQFGRGFGAAGGGSPPDWTATLDKLTASLKETFGQMGGSDAGVHKMLAFWELPFDNWQRTMSSLSLVPGDVLRNMPTEGMRAGLDRVLGAPGLGYAREEQGQYQELTRAVLEYQETLAEYLGFFSKMGIGAAERLQWQIKEAEAKQTPIASARVLYDTWVSCCEAEYADQVMTDDYSALHGRLVNALMRVKQRMAIIVDEYLGAMNMPTRRELRTLQDRVQEARRDTKQLRAELEALKRQGAATTSAPRAPARRTAASAASRPAAKAAAKPAAPRKTATTAKPRPAR